MSLLEGVKFVSARLGKNSTLAVWIFNPPDHAKSREAVRRWPTAGDATEARRDVSLVAGRATESKPRPGDKLHCWY